MRLSDWLKTASATFAGGAVAIGLVAIPTFVWLPREFDKVYAEASGAHEAAELARLASEEAKDASVATFQKIDDLVISIARMDAQPIVDVLIKGQNGTLQVSGVDSNSGVLLQLFPQDIVELIKASGEMNNIKYSNFGGQDWIFIDKASFNKFSLMEQKAIEEALSRKEARLFVE